VSGKSTSIALSREQIAAFRERPLVVVSPHFDDACFSLGCFLEEVGRGALLNVFTRGFHAPAHPEKHRKDAEGIFAVRDAEDRAFAERCGLERHDLEEAEPPLRGRHPLDLSYVSDDVARTGTKLIDALGTLAPSRGRKAALFTPMGIGRHANHRAIAEIIRKHAARLRERYDLFLYEDLPYAHHPLDRAAGLTQVRTASDFAIRARHTLAVPWERKRSLVALYASQFRRPPRWINFRPAAARPLSLHEAFWSTE
jgi:LmbE family N-acetylglucosaminyl deacetylase